MIYINMRDIWEYMSIPILGIENMYIYHISIYRNIISLYILRIVYIGMYILTHRYRNMYM